MQADKVCLIETKNRGTESDLESEGGKAAETQRSQRTCPAGCGLRPQTALLGLRLHLQIEGWNQVSL